MRPEWQGYVVYDTRLDAVRGMVTDPHEAAEIAAWHAIESGQDEFVWDAAMPSAHERAAVANAEDFSAMPRRALLASGLREVDESEVMRIGLEDAHRVVLSEFPERWQTIGEWNTPSQMFTNLIRTNTKLEKDYRDPTQQPAFVKGLSLVPARAVFTGISGNQAVRLPMEGTHSERSPRTLCLGSNEQCRSTCLSFTGNSLKSADLMVPRQSAARALVRHPEHFVRVLVESIRRFTNPKIKDGKQRYVRLNVYSDVPWELVAPWMFDMFPGTPYGSDSRPHLFYDYSKIPGRATPPNYDITFSFSGTNYARAEHELNRGRRAAVVFFLPEVQKEYGKFATAKGPDRKRRLLDAQRRAFDGATWLGRPVIDGTIDDVRPRDPGGIWIGLVWRPAKGWRGRTPDLFVLYAVKIDGKFTVAVTPRHLGVPTEEKTGAAIIKAREITRTIRDRVLPPELLEGDER